MVDWWILAPGQCAIAAGQAAWCVLVRGRRRALCLGLASGWLECRGPTCALARHGVVPVAGGEGCLGATRDPTRGVLPDAGIETEALVPYHDMGTLEQHHLKQSRPEERRLTTEAATGCERSLRAHTS